MTLINYEINPKNSQERILFYDSTVFGLYKENSYLKVKENLYSIENKGGILKTKPKVHVLKNNNVLTILSFNNETGRNSSINSLEFYYLQVKYIVERHPIGIITNHKGCIKIFHNSNLLIELNELKKNSIFYNFKDEGTIIENILDFNSELLHVLIAVALICKNHLRIDSL